MSPADIDALLFDFGGVLVEIDFDRVFARWAGLAGAPFAQVKARFSFAGAYERHERGELDAAGYFAALRGQLGLALDDAQLADGWARVLGPERTATVELLPRLAERVPIYLFSNTNAAHHEVWAARHAAALAPFRRHFLSFEIGRRKPERAAFEHVAEAIGVPPSRILFLDDTLENVEGARAAGLPAAHVPGPAEVARAVSPWLTQSDTARR